MFKSGKAIIVSILFSFQLLNLLPNIANAADWIRAESKHFIIYSKLKPDTTIDYVKSLENFHSILYSFYNENQTASNKAKLKLYLVRSKYDLKTVRSDISSSIVGFATNSIEGQFSISLTDGEEISNRNANSQEENEGLTTLFHEYSHMMMLNYSNFRYPLWFIEGFAEYYSTARLSKNNAKIGMAPRSRLYFIKNERLISYADLLKNNKNNTMKEENYYSAFYSQSWLLAHYLISDPERRKKLSEYFNAIQKGEDEVTAFEKIFNIKIDKLGTVLDKYLIDIKATLYTYKESMDPGEIKVEKLPASVDDLILLDFAISIDSNYAQAKRDFQKIISISSKYPNDEYVQEILAKAQIIEGDEADAIDFYKKKLEKNQNDEEALSRLGQIYFLLQNHSRKLENETLESEKDKARKYLLGAYKLNPVNDRTLYYYSLTSPTFYEKAEDNYINAALEAHSLSPTVLDYSLNAVYFLLGSGEIENAKLILSNMANDPHNKGRVILAKEALRIVNKGGPFQRMIFQIDYIHKEYNKIMRNAPDKPKDK